MASRGTSRSDLGVADIHFGQCPLSRPSSVVGLSAANHGWDCTQHASISPTTHTMGASSYCGCVKGRSEPARQYIWGGAAAIGQESISLEGSSGWRKSVSSSRTFARVACITYLLRLSQCVLSSSKVVRLFSLEFRSQHPTLRPFGAKRRCLHSYHERHTRCHRRTGTQRKGVPSSPYRHSVSSLLQLHLLRRTSKTAGRC
mmetsp:Transcript_13160/g.47986  ORF Transcript_13160/g.47986 Transcript_13160/m.47986 type:complete len:201 (+) Transcript_13160:1336-1938(+)